MISKRKLSVLNISTINNTYKTIGKNAFANWIRVITSKMTKAETRYNDIYNNNSNNKNRDIAKKEWNSKYVKNEMMSTIGTHSFITWLLLW